ncbi:hypothetical protein JCM10212_000962 [Sporobolomyces blumeae]
MSGQPESSRHPSGFNPFEPGYRRITTDAINAEHKKNPRMARSDVAVATELKWEGQRVDDFWNLINQHAQDVVGDTVTHNDAHRETPGIDDVNGGFFAVDQPNDDGANAVHELRRVELGRILRETGPRSRSGQMYGDPATELYTQRYLEEHGSSGRRNDDKSEMGSSHFRLPRLR